MLPCFLNLPVEIRLEIYDLLFGHGKLMIEAKHADDSSCLLPRNSSFPATLAPRSSQLLRVSRRILAEARPVLYANTTFHVLNQAFAGRLPTTISDGHPCAPYIKHLIWQLDCDILKHFYPDDMDRRLDRDLEESGRAGQWCSLEIRCRAESWRNSFLGEWCDREAFVGGRDQVLAFARVFHRAMSGSGSGRGSPRRRADNVNLIEDRSQLGRGRVIFRLSRDRDRDMSSLGPEVWPHSPRFQDAKRGQEFYPG